MPVAPSLSAPLKYVVGIDITKDTFVACLGRIEVSQQVRFGKEATFDNTSAGFAALLAWTAKQQATAAPLWFVVEATGVYYEHLAYFLADNQRALSVLLPNKVKHFAHSTEQKSKTDQLDARLLCRLGLERVLPAWQPPTPALRQLRALSRERQSLIRQGARLKTQRHAYAHSYQPDDKEHFVQVLVTMVEPKFTLFQMQFKGVLRHALELLEAGFGETPEGLDTVDVRSAAHESVLAVAHAQVAVKTYVHQPIIAAPAVGVDHRGHVNFAAYNGLQGFFRAVGYDFRVDLPAAFEQAEDDGSTAGSAAPFAAHPARTKVALIEFDRPVKFGRHGAAGQEPVA